MAYPPKNKALGNGLSVVNGAWNEPYRAPHLVYMIHSLSPQLLQFSLNGILVKEHVVRFTYLIWLIAPEVENEKNQNHC